MNLIRAIVLLGLMQALSTQHEQAVKDSPGLFDVAASKGVKEFGAGVEGTFLHTFTRAGTRRETLVLLAGAVFQTDSMTAIPSRCVSLVAAMPFNLGDGAVLKIIANDETRQQPVFQLSLDPAHVRADRKWLPVRFDIPAVMNHVVLRFEVTAGPRGDQTGDWIGLAPGSEPGCLFAEARPPLSRFAQKVP